jgi:multidrug resistance efflux pump
MPVASSSPTPNAPPVTAGSSASLWRTLLPALLALASGVAAAAWFEHRAASTIHAHLAVRTTFITAERTGRVLRLEAAEGERITPGSPLVVLSDSELESKLRAAEDLVESLTLEARQAKLHADLELAMHQQDLDDSIFLAQVESAGFLKQKYDHELTRSMLADLLSAHESAIWDNGDPLFKEIVLSQRLPSSQRMATVLQMEQASNQAEISAALVEISDQRITTLTKLKESLPARIQESCGVTIAEDRLKQAQADLDQLAARQPEVVVASPACGQVGVFRRHAGDELRPGDPIVELLDDSKRYLIAEVPSQRIHEFAPGHRVTLAFPGGEEREGRIVHIAPQAEPRDLSQRAVDPIVKVEIEQCGRHWPTVPIGSRIDVSLTSGL